MARILIIEDDAAVRRLLQVNFGARGYSVVTATTGYEALKLIREERPAVILVDYHIPDISGTELIQQVNADPATAGTPCLLVTGATYELMGDVAGTPGLTGVITKPIDLTDLYRKVADLVQ